MAPGRFLRTLLGIGCCLLAWICAAPAEARQFAYQDDSGRWVVEDEARLPKSGPGTMGRVTIRKADGGGITFNLDFKDVANSTGVGFDDPVEGAARRALIASIFEYLNTVFEESGNIDVEFRTSQTDASGFLATAGPIYYSSEPKFAPGIAFEAIHNNNPADTNDPNPGGPELRCTVDFGYPWNSALTPPGGGQYDLFSVLLHEITHGLGIISLIASDGSSQLNFGDGTIMFSGFDNLLYTGNGVKLLDSTPAFVANLGSLVGMDGGVVFRGVNATSILGQFAPLYTPATWAEGSSMSHWASTLTPDPLMEYSIGAAVSKRAYQPFEIGALEDIGYRIARPAQNRSRHWSFFD